MTRPVFSSAPSWRLFLGKRERLIALGLRPETKDDARAARLVKNLLADDPSIQFVILSSSDQRHLGETVQKIAGRRAWCLTGLVDFPQTLDLLSQSHLVVTDDRLLINGANAVGRPVRRLTGWTKWRADRPWRNRIAHRTRSRGAIIPPDVEKIRLAVEDYGVNHWLKKKIYLNLFRRPWHAPRLAAILASVRGEEILDIACATGELTDEIRRSVQPRRIVGYEGSRAVMEQGRLWHPEIDWVHGLVEELPFAAKSFDSIHAGEIVEHIRAVDEFIHRLATITRHQLVLTTPTEVVADPGHVAIFTVAALRELLREQFRRVRIIDAGRTYVAVCTEPKT